VTNHGDEKVDPHRLLPPSLSIKQMLSRAISLG